MKKVSLKLLAALFALLVSASVVMTSCDIDSSSPADERSDKEESADDEKDEDDEDDEDDDDDVEEKQKVEEDVEVVNDETIVENNTASSNVNNNKINSANNGANKAKELDLNEIISKSMTAIRSVDSCSIKSEVLTKVDVMGQVTESNIYMDGIMSLSQGNTYVEMDMETNGVSMLSEVYLNVYDDGADYYLGSGGMWFKQTGITSEQVDSLRLNEGWKQMEIYYSAAADNGEVTETYFDGNKCYKLETTFNPKNNSATISSYEQILNSFIGLLSQEQIEAIISDLRDTNVIIYVDSETYYPLCIEIEMKDSMASLYEGISSALLDSTGTYYSMSVSEASSVSEYRDFNSTEEIVIPQEALNGTETVIVA